MNKTIAIIGASGFIGRTLSQTLTDAGANILAISRKTVPDLADVASLTAALAGADVIVHLADSPQRLQSAANTPAIRAQAIVAAARAAGVSRVIYASSIYARITIDKQSAAYGTLKRESESVFQNAQDLHSVMLRLPPVYGRDAKGGFSVLRGLVARGLPVPFGAANALRDYISVDNLSNLIKVLITSDHKLWADHSGKIYEPSDGLAVSTRTLTAHLIAVLASKSRILNVPLVMLKGLGVVTRKSAAITAVLEPLEVRAIPSLKTDWSWDAPNQMPETLAFLKK